MVTERQKKKTKSYSFAHCGRAGAHWRYHWNLEVFFLLLHRVCWRSQTEYISNVRKLQISCNEEMNMAVTSTAQACDLVIFGAKGDLARR